MRFLISVKPHAGNIRYFCLHETGYCYRSHVGNWPLPRGASCGSRLACRSGWPSRGVVARNGGMLSDRLFVCRGRHYATGYLSCRLIGFGRTAGRQHLCIVCSGTGELNPTLDFTLEEPSILTNVRGWTAVVDWAYTDFERRGGGDLAVVTSIGGLRGSASAPAYNASKAYQINYVEGLCQRSVKSASKVRIMEIRPGLVDTAMAKGDGLFWVMPVDRVANQALRALSRGRRLTVVTRRWRIVSWILRLLPEFLYLRL